jgi:DNA-binding NarL/FixJ family response regulator
MAQTSTSTDKEFDDLRSQIEDTPKPGEDSSAEDRKEYRKAMNEFSKKAGELRKKQLSEDSSLTDKEKEILKLYNQGVQNYEIAKRVYEFVNQDTVGKVILTIRKAHSTDWNQVEDVNSTKGYTGVGR